MRCHTRPQDLLGATLSNNTLGFSRKHCCSSTLRALRSGGFVLEALCVVYTDCSAGKKLRRKRFKQEGNFLGCRSSSTLSENKLTQVIKWGEDQRWWELGVFGLDLLLKSLAGQRRILSLWEKTGSGLTTNAMRPRSR